MKLLRLGAIKQLQQAWQPLELRAQGDGDELVPGVLAEYLRWDLGLLIPDFLCAARSNHTAGKAAIRNWKSQRNHD
ncbi:MAG: hypothetical protein WBN92_08635 [Terriglobia bacterium]